MKANAALSKKNFIMRITISQKEVKESSHWLCPLNIGGNHFLKNARFIPFTKAAELIKICSAIMRNSE